MIYFAQAGEGGPIKIGVSSRDTMERVRSIDSGSPEPVRLLGVMAGLWAEERELHRRFRQVRGEWFEPTEDLLAYVATHTQSRVGRTRQRASGAHTSTGLISEVEEQWL
jgi:hypothetical protein